MIIAAADFSPAVLLNTESTKKAKFNHRTANEKIQNSLNGSDILSKPTQLSQSKINMTENDSKNEDEKKMEIDFIPYNKKKFISNTDDDTATKEQSKIQKFHSYSDDQNAVRMSFSKQLNLKSEAVTSMSQKPILPKSRSQPPLKPEKIKEIVRENKGKINIFENDRNFKKFQAMSPKAKKPSEDVGLIKLRAKTFTIADIKGSKIQSNNNIEEKKKYDSSPIYKSVSTEITRSVTPLTNSIKKSKSESVTQFSFRDRLFAAVSSSEDMTKDFQSINLNTHTDKIALSPSWKMHRVNDIQQKQKKMQKISNWYISADNSPDGTLLESFEGTNITAAGAVYTKSSSVFYTVQPTLLLLGRREEEMVGESNLSERSLSPFNFLDDDEDDETINQNQTFL